MPFGVFRQRPLMSRAPSSFFGRLKVEMGPRSILLVWLHAIWSTAIWPKVIWPTVEREKVRDGISYVGRSL